MAKAGGGAGSVDTGGKVGECLEHQPDLGPGQICADALVRPVPAESQVWVRITGDAEGERVIEDILVVVGAGVDQSDALPGPDLHAAQLDVGQSGALERGDRCGPIG